LNITLHVTERILGRHETFTGAERAARWRARLRAQGLRPIQLWVPDLRDPKVQAEIEREVASINASEDEAVILAWLDANNAELMGSLPSYDWGEGGPPE
jgi:Protein  of unknown function (DUF3018)